MSYTSNQTEAAVSGLNLTLKPVESFIYAGLAKEMTQLFLPRPDKAKGHAPAIWLNSADKKNALRTALGIESADRSSPTISYPNLFLNVTTMAEATGRMNVTRFAKRGQTVIVSDDKRRGYRVHFIPMDITIGVEFVTNSMKEVDKFVSRWMFARRNGHLKFNVDYGSLSFSVGMELDASVQIPTREADPESPGEYVVTPSLVIEGFISQPTLIEQQVATHLNVEMQVGANPEDGKGTVFWGFRTEQPEPYSDPSLDRSTQR